MSQPRRPVLVTVVAVVNFIYGGLGILTLTCTAGLIGLLVLLLQNAPAPPPNQPDQAATWKELGQIAQALPGFVPLYVTYYAVELVMLVVLIVSGFGLLRMRGWGR